MPRYFFNIVSPDRTVPDEEGSELPDLEAALAEAEAHAREMMIEHLRAGKKIDGRRFEITDDSGKILGGFAFRDLL